MKHIINMCLQDGTTPIIAAAQEGHLSTVELLLSAGANLHHCNNVSHYLISSCFIIPTIQDGGTALYFASMQGHLKVVQKLVDSGALVDVQDKVSCSDSTY